MVKAGYGQRGLRSSIGLAFASDLIGPSGPDCGFAVCAAATRLDSMPVTGLRLWRDIVCRCVPTAGAGAGRMVGDPCCSKTIANAHSRLEAIAMKRLLLASLIVLPLGAYAASGPDAMFYRHAAQGGLAEVDLGNLALKKSQDPAVKDFAAQMVKDHSAANEKLHSVAATKNITLPTKESVREMGTEAKLELLSGSTFDKAYIKAMLKDHKQDVAEFRREAAFRARSGCQGFRVPNLTDPQGALAQD